MRSPGEQLPARAVCLGAALQAIAVFPGKVLQASVLSEILLLVHNSTRMDINRSLLNSKDGYCLRLANGQGWHIIATEGVRSWVEKLTSIMELKWCVENGYPRIIFHKMDSGKEGYGKLIRSMEPSIAEGLPRSGWKAHDLMSLQLWSLNNGPGDGWRVQNLRSLQLWSHCDVPDVFFEVRAERSHSLDIIRMWQALFPIYQRAQESGGLPLHAALVKRNGTAILLAAPGGTGKSTCCRRFPSQWQPLCDDETLIVRDNQKRYLAHPFPTWSDYLRRRSERTWNVQQHLPLSAIFFIEQAETDEVVPIGQGEAAAFMNQSAMQVYRRNWRNLDCEELRPLKTKLFENACVLARVIPAFKLRVSQNGRFWEEMERVMV